MRILITSVVFLLACGALNAQEVEVELKRMRGWYAGGGLALADTGVSESDNIYGEYKNGSGNTGFVIDAGYRFNDYLAVELGYLDAGAPKWNDTAIFLPEVPGLFDTDVSLDISAYQASGLLIYPFFKRWEVYFKIGLSYWDAESDQVLTPVGGGSVIHRNLDDTGTDLLMGVGVGASLSQHLHLRFEYQSFFIDGDMLALNNFYDGSLDTAMLEVQYRFGDRWDRRERRLWPVVGE